MIGGHTLQVRCDIELNLFEKRTLNMALNSECIDLKVYFVSEELSIVDTA